MSEVSYTTNYIQERLFALKDEACREQIIEKAPQIAESTIIGVPEEDLVALAKEMAEKALPSFDLTMDLRAYLTTLPHQYFDENNLHMLLLSYIPDLKKCIWYMDLFLPYINSVMTTDLRLPDIFKENQWDLFPAARRWSWTDASYISRYGIRLLRELYMERWFFDRELDSVARTESTNDYVNEMVALYMHDALVHHWKLAIQVIEDRRLTPAAHEMTLKCVEESNQFTAEQKEYILSLNWDYYRPFPRWYQIDPVLPHKEWWWTANV